MCPGFGVPRKAINSFPIKVVGFHSDNGSEYINKQVASMLQKMFVEQTKSRSRRTNDNALVEGKNGAIVRKYMGYAHIPRGHAKKINDFDREHLNPYLNYHRFCGFATVEIDQRGKEKKKYDTYLTPIRKLMSLLNFEKCLKENVTKESLLIEERKMSHYEAAQKVYDEKVKLFKAINRKI